MLRSDVCQSVLDLMQDPTYLEIGVNEGITFHAVKAKRKIAVDPMFLFDEAAAKANHPECDYFQMTSDAYFGSADLQTEYDVIYLDGLHTAEQTLRDLMNAVDRIKKHGVIVIDDVKPSSFAASLPNVEHANYVKSLTGDKDLAWMGDVYKLVWFIDTFMQQWSFRTVNNNHGQVVMWRSRRAADRICHRLFEDVGRLGFDAMLYGLDTFKLGDMAEILSEIKSSYT